MATERGHLEREYKFSWAGPGLPEAEELRLALPGYSLQGPERREQLDRYFDSRRRHLAKAGVALRRRQVGTRELATFKGVDRGAGALHAREEIELPLEGGDWPAAVARRAAEFGPLHSLRPVLELSTRRSLYRVGQSGSALAELALDEVSAGLPGEEMRVYFTELELEARGDPGALAGLAEALASALPLVPSSVSKLERAEALLSLARTLGQEP